ncbi:hypothetical protein NL108_015781 [Boleophthalmus pectinirostris]|nr:hypothetical protein NL108_015781 [Boleophthalmus pectinirostris]
MGTSWSRSKKVSPECVKAENLPKSASSSKHGALFRPLSIYGLLRAARNRAPQDRARAESGNESAAEPGTGRTDAAVRPWRTHGDAGDERGRASTEPRGGGERDVSARGHARAERKWSSELSVLRCPSTAPSPAEADVSPHTHSVSNGRPLLAIPVHYNGSEEELMERIEREFS